MKTINIFWWNWQHALDLQERWIFSGFNSTRVEHSTETNKNARSSAVIVPISHTRWVIKSIIEQFPNQEIINFSGIMSTTPRENTSISNFHFLFWPKAKKWLKVAFAWKFSNRVNAIIENVTKSWITVIETDIETHDKIVSVVQAFTHMFIYLSWMSDNKLLISEWNTPDLTIWDMILENPIFLELLNDLIEFVEVWDDLSDIFLEEVSCRLTQININNFWTPTFWRVVNFCKNNKMIINEKMILALNEIKIREKLLIQIRNIKVAHNVI